MNWDAFVECYGILEKTWLAPSPSGTTAKAYVVLTQAREVYTFL